MSKLVDSNRLGVVDTDDMQEAIITYDELKAYVLDFGIEVAGVVVDRQFMTSVSRVEVYKMPYAHEVGNLRLDAIYGITTQMRCDHLEYFRCGEHIKPGAVIRLSDVCSSCGQSIFRQVLHGFILVLDDRVNVSYGAFKNFVGHKIVFDCRELTREDTIQSIAGSIVEFGVTSQDIDRFIIATDELKAYFKSL